MARYLAIVAALALLALSGMVWAQPTPIPSETHWTPYPPARKTVDTGLSAEVQKGKGVITAQEPRQLAQPQPITSSGSGREATRQSEDSYKTSP
jgi:hypothetical protein